LFNRRHTKYLRALAHDLKPVIIAGNKGITQAVIAETDRALDHHELIKVKLAGADREQRVAMAAQLCRETDAAEVSTIGRVLTIYRENPEKEDRIRMPSR
jgi:RNA-binding protein